MKIGLVLLALGLLVWVLAYGQLKTALSERLTGPFPTGKNEQASYNAKASTTGGHFIYLSCKRDQRQLPSDFTNWKDPTIIRCDIQVTVTNRLGGILETNCRALIPAMLKGNDVFYYLVEFGIQKTGTYTVHVENRTDLNVFIGREPALQIRASEYLEKTRIFRELLARIFGGVFVAVGASFVVYTFAKRK
jgi:hypothetical protein